MPSKCHVVKEQDQDIYQHPCNTHTEVALSVWNAVNNKTPVAAYQIEATSKAAHEHRHNHGQGEGVQ